MNTDRRYSLPRVRNGLARVRHLVLMGEKRLRQRIVGKPGQVRVHVFVAGMQRSGTNMLCDCLERSDQTDVFHETDPRAFDDYLMRPATVIHGLARQSRAECFVIKALCELDQLNILMDEFTPARTVWIVRDFNDVVNSARLSFKSLPGDLDRLSRDRASAAWRGRGMSDETFAHLQRLYHPGINPDSAIALFWYLRNVLFFESGLAQDPRALLVRYERLVLKPEDEFRRLFDFLGLRYTARISRQVFTHSIRKRALPEIEPDVRSLCEALMARFDLARDW